MGRFIFLFFLWGAVFAATLPPGFSEAPVAAGAIGSATAFDFAPDGRIFVCEQTGAVRVIKNGTLLATPFATFSVDPAGERGLLGVAFDPEFELNQHVYFYYTVSGSPKHNRVVRVTANGDVAQSGSEILVLRLDDLTAATNHNGGAIHFGADGKLYAGVGENATGSNAQSLTNLLGKMLRINKDGSIPQDNPFLGSATGINQAIWALGLRNPFTFAIQPGTERMLINDVGAGTFEEINDGIGQSNYGWPATEGATALPQFRSPLYAYGHGIGAEVGCAIAGGTFYNPQVVQFPGEYVGKYFYADLCSGWIRQLDLANNTASGFATGISAPVDLKTGPDGSLYYLSRGSGMVFRVRWNSPAAPEKAGIFRAGMWLLDYNGNGIWDGPVTDRLYWLGQAGDTPLVGDWNGDGRKKIGLFRDGMWLLDYNGNGAWDGSVIDRLYWLGQTGDTPLIGDWNGDGRTKIGFFRAGMWLWDYNGNGVWDGPVADRLYWIGQAGDAPLMGDWNGDGRKKIGFFRAGMWLLDYNGNGTWDGAGEDRLYWIGQVGDTPLASNWNGDNKAEIGFFRNGLWLLDQNGDGAWNGLAADKLVFLGMSGDKPVLGAW